MVLDFGDLKAIVKEEIVDEWDHGLMVNALSPHKDLGKELEQKGHKVIYCDYQPTCENMLYEIADKIKKRLPSQSAVSISKTPRNRKTPTENGLRRIMNN